MASIFTYQDEPPRIHSPWSTPGNSTPHSQVPSNVQNIPISERGITKLEAEKPEGPCEYKLHLLLRARRKFVSMTTIDTNGHLSSSMASSASTNARSMSESLLFRPSYQPSPQTRQARLQQLTTQLLWRLQQSSPFHSSSNAELILPVLPEATPRLGVPERPAKLLPGLEESQGALYEIGVADDGTLVGLIDEELDESLNNLRAMAASLGCVVDILRKVQVGQCEWSEVVAEGTDTTTCFGKLFVAEVLIRPDARGLPEIVLASNNTETHDLPNDASKTSGLRTAKTVDQIRVTIVGPSTAGKSSLIGTLTTSMLDNGRGKSRLSLLKHRHEIASGVTSSVAHELVGYRSAAEGDEKVINYATGDVSSWTDIHNLSDRLCFLIDSPGLPRYAKSIFRSIVSWQPHWTLFCISAEYSGIGNAPMETVMPKNSSGDEIPSGPDLAHLDLCLKLSLPIVVVLTAMDYVTKSGLRSTLSQVLSKVKGYNRTPLVLSSTSKPLPSFSLDMKQALPDIQQISSTEHAEIERTLQALEADPLSVPVVMTSVVSGVGIGKVHALLQRLPVQQAATSESDIVDSKRTALFHIDEVFSIPPSRVYSSNAEAKLEPPGVVLCGHLKDGAIRVGDELLIGPFNKEDSRRLSELKRSKSFTIENLRRLSLVASSSAPRPMQRDAISNDSQTLRSAFLAVRVVSIRVLRLPVTSMDQGQTGTVGVELVEHSEDLIPLQKARKGMVLYNNVPDLRPSRSFSAVFSSADFHNVASPPLLLGGLALIYINSIRAAVKLTAFALIEDDVAEPDSPVDLFAFDGDGEAGGAIEEDRKEVRITFRFVNTVEALQVDDQIMVVPTTSASGPVTGPLVSTAPLAGFVGKVDETFE